METTLIVDGYNAINAIGETRAHLERDLRSAREAIVAISREYARSSGYITRVRVVFDGQDRYRHRDGAGISRAREQVFSRTDQGDDKIIETINKFARLGRVVLASNDNYVRNNARAYGAAVITSDELAGKKPCRVKAGKVREKKISGKVKDRITKEYREELGL
jgi:predicted RNA-binding protein with PIN domain